MTANKSNATPGDGGQNVEPNESESAKSKTPFDRSASEATTLDVNVDQLGSQLDELDALREELDEAKKQALRFQADLENFRNRTRRETQESLRYASLPLITALLDVLDNLDRALEAATGENQADSLKTGVEIVAAQMIETLEQHGCQRIKTVGQPFDPNFHEAMQMQPSDEVEENHIILEVQSGYKLHDRVVRPAKVMISTGPARKKKKGK